MFALGIHLLDHPLWEHMVTHLSAVLFATSAVILAASYYQTTKDPSDEIIRTAKPGDRPDDETKASTQDRR